MATTVRYCQCYKSLKEPTVECPNKATFGDYCGHHKNCQQGQTKQPKQPKQPLQPKQAPDYLSGEQSLVLQRIAEHLPTKDLDEVFSSQSTDGQTNQTRKRTA